MKSFEELWTVDPVTAVSEFLKLRNVVNNIDETVNELGLRTKVTFRTIEDVLWVITAYNADDNSPRITLGLYSEEEPVLDLWDKLYLVEQEKLYHCTRNECLFLAFNLLADVEKIVSGEYKPVNNPYLAS